MSILNGFSQVPRCKSSASLNLEQTQTYMTVLGMTGNTAGGYSSTVPDRIGRYQILEYIASGGTALVYLATLCGLHSLSKRVIVKQLHPKWRDHPSMHDLLMDEGRLISRLHHPNIVQVFEMGEYQGLPFLVMEYVPGVTLMDYSHGYLMHGQKIPLNRAIHIILELLRALIYVHDYGIDSANCHRTIHRDISPSNILIGFQGDIKLIDFGISKGQHRSDHTVLNELRGTIAYMSPEQARLGMLDVRSDLYSCGLIFYEMIMMMRAYDAKDATQLLHDVQCGNVGALNSNIPCQLADIIKKSIQFNKSKRYQSAHAMYDDIAGYAKQVHIDCSRSMHCAPMVTFKKNNDGNSLVAMNTAITMLKKDASVLLGKSLSSWVSIIMVVFMICIHSIGISDAPIQSKWLQDKPAKKDNIEKQLVNGNIRSQMPMPASLVITSSPEIINIQATVREKSVHCTTPCAFPYIVDQPNIQICIAGNMSGFHDYSHCEHYHDFQDVIHHHVELIEKKKKNARIKIKRGALFVQSKPWAIAMLDNNPKEYETPIHGQMLAFGTHTITFIYPPTTKRYDVTITMDQSQLHCLLSWEPTVVWACK